MASDVSDVLRAEVARRAGYRCEYCLIHEEDAGLPHQVVSRKHGGLSSAGNLAYACILCNRYKGAGVASLDPWTESTVRLFHPRRDRWEDHLRLDGEFIHRTNLRDRPRNRAAEQGGETGLASFARLR